MLKDWLGLIYLRVLSNREKRLLVEVFGSPAAIFGATAQQLHEAGLNAGAVREIQSPCPAGRALVEQDWQQMQRLGAVYIGFNEPGFPPLLNQIAGAPLGLFILGNPELLAQPQIAVVGSRNASPAGLVTARDFAGALGRAGLVVTSGLATGVDSAAHHGSLQADKPTIAVMATGIDRVYPLSNRRLYQAIVENGAVVSEFPPGTPARRAHFPGRNRIISGLSLGVVVIEAGSKSGSLITARLAAEQGREVFAVPNAIRLATGKGCHQLIRDGATLVDEPAQVLEELQWGAAGLLLAQQTSPSAVGLAADEKQVYNLLDYAPIAMDQLIAQSGLPPERISVIMVELELAGLIAETGAGFQKL